MHARWWDALGSLATEKIRLAGDLGGLPCWGWLLRGGLDGIPVLRRRVQAWTRYARSPALTVVRLGRLWVLGRAYAARRADRIVGWTGCGRLRRPQDARRLRTAERSLACRSSEHEGAFPFVIGPPGVIAGRYRSRPVALEGATCPPTAPKCVSIRKDISVRQAQVKFLDTQNLFDSGTT